MKQKKQFISSLIIVTGIYLSLMIYFINNRLLFIANNYFFCMVIVLIFIFGYIWTLIQFIKINNELAPLHKIKNTQINSIQDIIFYNSGNSIINKRIQNIISIYDISGQVDYNSLKDINKNQKDTSGIIIKYFVNILILIGLLGTFIGIYKSVDGFSLIANDSIESNIGINNVIGGLDVALGTSVLGIISSILLGYILILYKNYEKLILNEIEIYIVVNILPHFQIAEQNAITKAIVESMNRTLPKVVRESTEKLLESTENLFSATTNLKNNQDEIVILLDKYSELVDKTKQSNESFFNIIIQLKIEIENINNSLNKYKDKLDKQNIHLEELVTLSDESKTSITSLSAILNISMENNNELLNIVSENFDKLIDKINLINNYSEEYDKHVVFQNSNFEELIKTSNINSLVIENLSDYLKENITKILTTNDILSNTLIEMSKLLLKYSDNLKLDNLSHLNNVIEIQKKLSNTIIDSQKMIEISNKSISKYFEIISKDIKSIIPNNMKIKFPQQPKTSSDDLQDKILTDNNQDSKSFWSNAFRRIKINNIFKK